MKLSRTEYRKDGNSHENAMGSDNTTFETTRTVSCPSSKTRQSRALPISNRKIIQEAKSASDHNVDLELRPQHFKCTNNPPSQPPPSSLSSPRGSTYHTTSISISPSSLRTGNCKSAKEASARTSSSAPSGIDDVPLAARKVTKIKPPYTDTLTHNAQSPFNQRVPDIRC
ncbi:hypothetical protein EJ05DRAFT_15230 [Pseudovirgaria hyperparasitica]|uniref:Uncharacterized protein n=1 Tax=Pseudovirgaria hyperparasitica TaxID=470096 RepID=A0A6A6WKT3_9PEZI|nr:uncharacterized protein EJ05DRAFT_15230 [Pseudovirgaria hyperparasitica]KAF2762782.1 hypothetical protein EJ05DRAFT_15230 [Pseudovirgaria hyperparasitica]